MSIPFLFFHLSNEGHFSGCHFWTVFNISVYVCMWTYIFILYIYIYIYTLSLFSHVQLYATPWTVVHQAPLSMEFSRQNYWSGLPCPSPGDLPNPGIELTSLTSPSLAGGFFTNWESTYIYI